MAILAGFYLEIDDISLIHEADPKIILSFMQIVDESIERHRLIVTWQDIYLSHYDPTVLAVCVIYDRQLWLLAGFKKIIGVERCTSNYQTSYNDECVDVMTLPTLIRSASIEAIF